MNDLGIQKRSIPLCIVLTIITCGVFGLYWMFTLTEDISTVYGQDGDTSGGLAVLLELVTCGIYGYFWSYTIGKRIDNHSRTYHGYDDNYRILFLVFKLLGLGIITFALAQNTLNQYIDARH